VPFLIDTDVAIHLRDQVSDIVGRVANLGERPFLSIISQVELENGVYKNRALTEIRRPAVDLMLKSFVVLPFDAEAMYTYRTILAGSGYSRRKVSDRMVAATALVHDLTLITMNGRDFTDIAGLKLAAWPSPTG
jgi:tRNA(fMet)-specific endonuclease VapC